jgi:hypothetical protein
MDSQDVGGLLMIYFDRVHPPHLLYKRWVEAGFGVLSFGLSCDLHIGVVDTPVHITAVSMTPLCMSQRSH